MLNNLKAELDNRYSKERERKDFLMAISEDIFLDIMTEDEDFLKEENDTTKISGTKPIGGTKPEFKSNSGSGGEAPEFKPQGGDINDECGTTDDGQGGDEFKFDEAAYLREFVNYSENTEVDSKTDTWFTKEVDADDTYDNYPDYEVGTDTRFTREVDFDDNYEFDYDDDMEPSTNLDDEKDYNDTCDQPIDTEEFGESYNFDSYYEDFLSESAANGDTTDNEGVDETDIYDTPIDEVLPGEDSDEGVWDSDIDELDEAFNFLSEESDEDSDDDSDKDDDKDDDSDEDECDDDECDDDEDDDLDDECNESKKCKRSKKSKKSKNYRKNKVSEAYYFDLY